MYLVFHRYKLSLVLVLGLWSTIPRCVLAKTRYPAYPLPDTALSATLQLQASASYTTSLTSLSIDPILPIQQEDTTTSQPNPVIHPRKKLLDEAPLHTERSWLYSAIIPGLGQFYNKDYWRLPIIYGIFFGLGWGAVYNHGEYTKAKREFIEKDKKLKANKEILDKDISNSNLGNFMTGRKRDRTIFIVAMGVWHVINIFDAYVSGTLATFDISDDLEMIVKPSEPNLQQPGIGLSFGLQPKTTY